MCHTMLLGRNVQETGGFNEFGRSRLPMVEVMDLDRTCKSSGEREGWKLQKGRETP